jgi:hypothetical protein
LRASYLAHLLSDLNNPGLKIYSDLRAMLRIRRLTRPLALGGGAMQF